MFQERAVRLGFLKEATPILSLLDSSDNSYGEALQILLTALWQISSHPVKQDW